MSVGLVNNPTHEVHPLKHQDVVGRILPSVNSKQAEFARFGTMPIGTTPIGGMTGNLAMKTVGR